MIISYTANDTFLSKLQRFLGKERISHVGLLFFRKNVAFDCSTSGFKSQPINRFYQKNNEVCLIPIDMTMSDEDQCCDILFSHCGDGYNFKAWFWLIYRGILYKFFGLYPPPKNPYYSKKTYLCTNIADPIAEIMIKYGIDLYPMIDDTITPERQYECLQHQSRGYEPISR